jgi:hypothetical protein
VGWGKRSRATLSSSSNAGFPVVVPTLEVKRWYSSCRFFTFGVPADWRDFTGVELSELSARNGEAMIAAIAVVDEPPPLTYIAVGQPLRGISPKEFTRSLPALSTERAHARSKSGDRMVGTRQMISVGGEPAMALTFHGIESGLAWGEGAVEGADTEVYTVHQDRLFLIGLNGRVERHDSRLSALLTVLGTWRWA